MPRPVDNNNESFSQHLLSSFCVLSTNTLPPDIPTAGPDPPLLFLGKPSLTTLVKTPATLISHHRVSFSPKLISLSCQLHLFTNIASTHMVGNLHLTSFRLKQRLSLRFPVAPVRLGLLLSSFSR